MEYRGARYINIALGIWLAISAFIWRHGTSQLAVTAITGVIIALVALTAIRVPRTRFINVGLGIWLNVSAFAFPHMTMGTVWNNIFVGVIVGYLALVGPPSESAQRPA